ncbi:LpqB family beta-propeller domain-containing protein [Cryptosporangium phraense]|uniref:GerMN domain-containing protein n=1 Tax=Cryptosporangium phraense TaxID=2593070 RepID=A0A545AGW2_9ACTN|nr:LpqB family beta-propeller domain-containing protein [Cryptosporangium phraense]TQS40544.1 hypothetical protein FL583_34490 [Cryptosporangium phraense]
MARPGVVRWAAAALVATALAGCAHVPDSGPAVPIAVSGGSPGGEASNSSVNTELPGPSGDADTSVRSYVNALLTTRNPGPLGDRYLPTKALRTAFSQIRSVVIVKGDITTSVAPIAAQADTTTATFRADLLGTVDSDGVFQHGENPSWQLQVRIQLVRGNWVFAEPPPIIVKTDQFGTAFSEQTVYYAAAPSAITGTNPRLVVPETRYVNEDISDQPSQLVDYVLAGPSAELSRVAANPLPNIKRTRRVAVEDGDLIIELEPEAESASKEALNAFVAEVGWSLSDSFQGAVRLLVGGRPLDVDGFAATQPQSVWRRYNPAVVSEPGLPAFQIRNGAVRELTPGGNTEPDRPGLKRPILQKGVHSAAVSVDLTRLAIVRDEPGGGQRLWVADASGTLQPTLRAPEIGRPTWGGNRSTVAVPINGRVLEVGVGNVSRPTEVRVIGPGGRSLTDVSAIRLSLDGVRGLVINGEGSTAKLYYGTLTGATGGVLVLTVRELEVDGTPRDVSWYGLANAAVAVEQANGRISVVLAPIDGTPAHSQSSDRSAPFPTTVRIAADPTANPEDSIPLEVGGKIVDYSVNSRPLNPDTPGAAPFYPG